MVEIETPIENQSKCFFEHENAIFQQTFQQILQCLQGKSFSLLMFLKNENNNVASFRSNNKLKLENFINPAQYNSLQIYTDINLVNPKKDSYLTGKLAEIELGIRPFYHQMNKLITSSNDAIIKRNEEAKRKLIQIDENQNPPENKNFKQKPNLKITIPQNPFQQQMQQQKSTFNMPIAPQMQPLRCSQTSNPMQMPYCYSNYQQNDNYQQQDQGKEIILKKLIKKEKIKQKKFRNEMKRMMKEIQEGIQKNKIRVKYEYNSDDEKESKKLEMESKSNQKQPEENKSKDDFDIFLKFLKFQEFKYKQNDNFSLRNNTEKIKQFYKQEQLKQKSRNPSISTKSQQTKSQIFAETQSQSTKIGTDFIEPLQKNHYENFKQPEEFFDFLQNCDNNSCQFQDNL